MDGFISGGPFAGDATMQQPGAGASSMAAGSQQQQQPEAGPSVRYASTEDFSSKVEIYRGRHSVVWNVVCRATKRPLILKGYMKAKMTERNFHQVRREIRLMQQISYEGAVKLQGTFEDSAAIYLVQEICAKGDLFKKLIRSGGVLDEKYVAAEVILPLLMTLQHLHARKIYHRDIKPENIFFMKDGHMKLGDFGLAIDATAERPKSRVGTLDYMSPEVVSLPTADERKRMEQQGRPVVEQTYSEKVDIWAAGILAYELLVGKPPFEVDDEQETRRRIMYETTLTFPPHVGPEAVSFIKTALAKNAGMRPDAGELLHHPWLRPHVAAALAGGGGGGASAAAAGESKAAVLAALRAGTAGLGQMGRSVSFSAMGASGGGASSGGGLHHRGPAGLTVTVGGADDLGISLSASGAATISSFPGASSASAGVLPGGGFGFGAMSGLGHAGLHSPTGSSPATPGPYGPPGGGGRKPVWEVDAGAPVAFTAVRTAGLTGDTAPPSPSSPCPTSPGRSKLSGGPGALSASAAASSGGSFGGGSSGSNPLLKAALNSSLHRISHTMQQQQQGGGGGGSSTGAVPPRPVGAAANVKMRIKEYFVARSTNEASVGGRTLTG